MSRAFVKEVEYEINDLPDRPVSTARLSQSCLPESCSGFSATLTTMAFDHSSLRWLEINT